MVVLQKNNRKNLATQNLVLRKQMVSLSKLLKKRSFNKVAHKQLNIKQIITGLINRKNYIQQLEKLIDEHIIKVVNYTLKNHTLPFPPPIRKIKNLR